ncbi:hypothetical protein DYB37_010367 [Aphanomyces astaci]|uniref:Uncharacterized protein n=1 Tax=Aphanomyces astaci TaxID=112090 RepID=A0A3R7A340_APHAT|nr:hypothetical protein DYB37_010367 [Aphanomyces astaci]
MMSVRCNATFHFQPLDVSIMAPFKRHLRDLSPCALEIGDGSLGCASLLVRVPMTGTEALQKPQEVIVATPVGLALNVRL